MWEVKSFFLIEWGFVTYRWDLLVTLFGYQTNNYYLLTIDNYYLLIYYRVLWFITADKIEFMKELKLVWLWHSTVFSTKSPFGWEMSTCNMYVRNSNKNSYYNIYTGKVNFAENCFSKKSGDVWHFLWYWHFRRYWHFRWYGDIIYLVR